MKWIVLLLVLVISQKLIAGTIDPKTPDQKYLDYGNDFHYVLKICGEYQDNTPFCASAVAIKPNWALTAAHVVKNHKTVLIKIKDRTIKATNVICHKDFEEKNFGFYDIAICKIEEDFELDFYPEIYEGKDELGKICCMSGWGVTGTFETGAYRVDGKRRAGSNKIDAIDRNLLVCTPSITNRTNLEFLISHGDSGGGLFIDNKLAGINSCVMAIDKKPNSNYSDESGHTRLSLFKDWIEEQIKNSK